MIEVYEIKCPEHTSFVLRSVKIITFSCNSLTVSGKQKTWKGVKKNNNKTVATPLFFCKRCNKYYIQTAQFPNRIHIQTLYHDDNRSFVNTYNKITRSKVSETNITEKTVLSLSCRDVAERIKVLTGVSINCLTSGNKRCKKDNSSLFDCGSINLHYKGIYGERNATVSCRQCIGCGRLFIDESVKKIANEVISPQMISNANLHITETLIRRRLKNRIDKLLLNKTNYFLKDISYVESGEQGKCECGANYYYDKNCFTVTRPNETIEMDAGYCLKCFNLVIRIDDSQVDRLTSFLSGDETDYECKLVRYSCAKRKNVELQKSSNPVSFENRYGKSVLGAIVAKSIIHEKSLDCISDILSLYGYSLKTMDDDIWNEDLLFLIKERILGNGNALLFNYSDIETSLLQKIIEKGSLEDVRLAYYCVSGRKNLKLRFVWDEGIDLFLKLKSPSASNEVFVPQKVEYDIKYCGIIVCSGIFENRSSGYKEITQAISSSDDYNQVLKKEERLERISIPDKILKLVQLEKQEIKKRLSDTPARVIVLELVDQDDCTLKIKTDIPNLYNDQLFRIEVDSTFSCDVVLGKKLHSEIQGVLNDNCTYESNNDHTVQIKAADFIVRSTNHICVFKEHNLKSICAVVRVMNKDKMYDVELLAAYCPKCNKYYIYEDDYLKMSQYGYICCRIDTYDNLVSIAKNPTHTFQPISILRTYGYRVDQKTDLSDGMRHYILQFVIENGILNEHAVISHINNQINLRKGNPYMEIAIDKWKNDIGFVKTMKSKKNKVIATKLMIPKKINLKNAR